MIFMQASLLVNTTVQIRLQVLGGYYFQREKVRRGGASFEHQVIDQVADSKINLSFRILVDEEINIAFLQISHVLFQQIVAD